MLICLTWLFENRLTELKDAVFMDQMKLMSVNVIRNESDLLKRLRLIYIYNLFYLLINYILLFINLHNIKTKILDDLY